MNTGLQARIYDPLWLLARQWQLGEFRGEDNGSPISISLQYDISRLTRYQSRRAAGLLVEPYDSRVTPLEVMIEREPAQPTPGGMEMLTQSAEAGLQFLRMLDARLGRQYREPFLARFPMPAPTAPGLADADAGSRLFARMMYARAPNGAALAAYLRATVDPANNTFGADPPIKLADLPVAREIALAWLRWYDTLISQPGAPSQPSSWNPERMEYAFAVAAPLHTQAGARRGEIVLTAQEYYDETPDWHDFSIQQGASLGAATLTPSDPAPRRERQVLFPTRVGFRGMPAHRWWEFEDAVVDLGAITTAPHELARMLMLEFALTWGNDWFLIPLDLPVGSLSRISSLIVTDTFGVRTLILSATGAAPAAGALSPYASAWRMFSLTQVEGAGPQTGPRPVAVPPDFLFLPPTLGRTMESAPLEDVMFLRDEMANLVWGIERLTTGPAGTPVNRRELHLERLRREEDTRATVETPETAPDVLQYRLMTEAPDYWIPFLPTPAAAGSAQIRLRRGAIAGADGRPTPTSARGRVLVPEPGRPLLLHEEEVPREGIRVTRLWRMARWIDGGAHLWIGRHKKPGRGEGSSGLTFDQALDPNQK